MLELEEAIGIQNRTREKIAFIKKHTTKGFKEKRNEILFEQLCECFDILTEITKEHIDACR